MAFISAVSFSLNSAPSVSSLVSTLMRIEFESSFKYPFLSMEPISALTVMSRSLPEKSISPTTFSASAFNGSTLSTFSLLFTVISMLGLTSREMVEDTL